MERRRRLQQRAISSKLIERRRVFLRSPCRSFISGWSVSGRLRHGRMRTPT